MGGCNPSLPLGKGRVAPLQQGETEASCTSEGENMCASCIEGFTLYGKAGQDNTGTPALVAPRLLVYWHVCWRWYWCRQRRRLHPEWQGMSGLCLQRPCSTAAAGEGNACQASTCTCTSGIVATGVSGTYDGVWICASCNAGFALNGNPCPAITCTCTSSTAAAGASCTSEGVVFVQFAARVSP